MMTTRTSEYGLSDKPECMRWTKEEAMKSLPVLAVVRLGDELFHAEFNPSTGRLVVAQDSKIFDELEPPDSWMAIASVSCQNRWGMRPTSADLLAFLERHVALHCRAIR